MLEANRVPRRYVVVNSFTDGILDPHAPMLGPLENGGIIVASTAPGCWGPMITPHLRGGHEVTQPVYVEGAEPRDTLVIRIRNITVTSLAAASGVDMKVEGHYIGDPTVVKRCPNCDILYPNTYVKGIGPEAIRCDRCGLPVHPFQFLHGYTAVFDKGHHIGITVDRENAERIAQRSKHYAALPDQSVQYPALLFAPHDLVGVPIRLRPFLGQLGTLPSIKMPDSRNAGDLGTSLIGAEHEYALTAEDLEAHRTDAHMDIDAVRTGAILLAPIKVPGAGVYMGDMHALQGDGEIAGHTLDVAGIVILQVEVLKGCFLEGPVLLPLKEDLPPLARPLGEEEKGRARWLARQWGLGDIEESAPISVIGTGPDLNTATLVGLKRAARLLGMTIEEVRNRATITGAIEIGRLPGVVQVTFLTPLERLEKAGLLPLVHEQYGI